MSFSTAKFAKCVSPSSFTSRSETSLGPFHLDGELGNLDELKNLDS